MALSPKERQEAIDSRKGQIKHRTDESVRQLDDEVRTCRCGWKITKSEAIRQGIKNCPRCGGNEMVGQSLDFNLTPDSVRQGMNQGQRGG